MNPKNPHVERFLLRDLTPELLLDELGQVFSIQASETVTVERRYLDSFDWRLHQSGYGLLEVLSPSESFLQLDDLKNNLTITTIPVERSPNRSSDLPPIPSLEVIQNALGIRALLPQLEERIRTREISLLDQNKTVLAKIVLECQGCLHDTVTGKKYPLPTSILYEPIGQSFEAQHLIRSTLHQKLQPSPDHHPLFDSLTFAGRSPKKSSFTLLAPQDRSDTAVKKVLLLELSKMIDNEPGLRNNIDTEFLHDYRVALRRSRTIFGQMKQVLPLASVQYFQAELKWLGDVTGPARDLDVYLQLLQSEELNRVSIDRQSELEPLHNFLVARREIRQQQIVDAFDSPRYQLLLQDWRKFLEAEPDADVPEIASLPISVTVSRRIWKLFRKIIRKGTAITRHSPDTDLHQLRLECKKLRYLLEAFQSLYPAKQISLLIQSMKRLQDNLGKHQDCAIQNRMLTGFAREMALDGGYPVETFLAMGRLSAHLENQQTATREAFRDRFLQFAKTKNQTRFKKLFKP